MSTKRVVDRCTRAYFSYSMLDEHIDNIEYVRNFFLQGSNKVNLFLHATGTIGGTELMRVIQLERKMISSPRSVAIVVIRSPPWRDVICC